MFEGIINFFKRFSKNEDLESGSKDTAKERLHLVLMQDRANVSADFLDMMKQEIIDVIKKYIEVDEKEIDVKLTNKTNEDGSIGAPALYANIPISKIKNENKQKNNNTKEITKKEIEDEKAKEETEQNKYNELEELAEKESNIKNLENIKEENLNEERDLSNEDKINENVKNKNKKEENI